VQTTFRVLGVWLLLIATAAAEDGSWKQPLSLKERAIEANILKRHNILGLYPSQVMIPPNHRAMDISTATPYSDIVHAVCWTSNYLAGASYRYRFLKQSGAPPEVVAAARRRADELFEAVYRCQRITGVRGLQARGYFLGHGPVYAERWGSRSSDDWHQGEADHQAFRWRGDPSHHNYSDAIHGLGQYYDLVAEGPQKDRARQAIDALVSYWVDNDLLIHKLDRSRRAVPILGLTDGHTLNTRVMMAIAGAKVAHHATGKAKFKLVYDRLLKQYGVRGLKSFHSEKDFDDAEHVFCHLENLFRIEKDTALLDAYGVVADGLWQNHKHDRQSLFTYIYYSIRPHAPGREEAMQQALRSLVTWPTDMTLKPRMNSLFADRKPPFPVYQAAWDNEYIWKGNLLRADGWLSRIVTCVDVSPQDPMVIAAVDERGDLYLSRDGAASYDGWQWLEHQPQSPVRSVRFGAKSRMLAIACDGGFYLSTTGGASWKRLPLPADSGKPVQIVFDADSPLALYAVTSKGIYHSRDYGEAYLGQSWTALTDDLPRDAAFRFYVAAGRPVRLFARDQERFFTKKANQPKWTIGGQVGLGEYSTPLNFFAVDPANPEHAFAGAATRPGQFPLRTIVQETTDGGKTWSNDQKAVFKIYAEGKLPQFLAALPEGRLQGFAFDLNDKKTLYAFAERGILRSRDGGRTWQAK